MLIHIGLMVSPEHAEDIAALYELLEGGEGDNGLLAIEPRHMFYWLDCYLDKADNVSCRELGDNLKVVLNRITKLE